MADRIQLRRDTAANWVSANPVLADGEIGIEKDTRKAKVGNGSTAWSSLAYLIDASAWQAAINALPSTVNSLTSSSTVQPLSANQGRVLKGFIDSINTLLQSDDSSLDELQEIVDFVKLNRADLNALGISSIAGLTTALAGKAPTTHTHTAAQVTGLTKATVGLGNVDNTSDTNKPVSTQQLAALNNKVDKVAGQGLSTNDYSNADKNKLNAIAAGATANATDAQLRARSSHTGTQAASTITGLASVATSGNYNDLGNRPTIPTSPGGDFVGSTATQTLEDKTFGVGTKESVTTGAVITISDASAPFQHIVLTSNVTATVSLGMGVSRSVWIDPATHTVSWPPSIKWLGDETPDLKTGVWNLIEFVRSPKTSGATVLAGLVGDMS